VGPDAYDQPFVGNEPAWNYSFEFSGNEDHVGAPDETLNRRASSVLRTQTNAALALVEVGERQRRLETVGTDLTGWTTPKRVTRL
jgi:hypothetical protein